MKSRFEPIAVEPHTSWTLLDSPLTHDSPFAWHHHAVWELRLTLNSRGFRHVGHDVAPYDDGDLVLVAPEVPHCWCSALRVRDTQPPMARVICFSDTWARALAHVCPEMSALQALLTWARPAVQFSPAVADGVRPTIEHMADQDAPARLVSLLRVLEQLSRDADAQRIGAAAVCRRDLPLSADVRVRRVLDVMHRRYAEALRLADLAAMACMSVSAFHRTFRKHTQCSAMDYVTKLRIGHACRLLLHTDRTVSRVAEDVGYGSLALFNRQFKALKGVPPSAFRRQRGALPLPPAHQHTFAGGTFAGQCVPCPQSS